MPDEYDASEHIIGYGKQLAFADTEGGEYTPILGTIDVQLPDRELGKSEVTNDNSPNFTKAYIPAIYEPGTVPFTYRYGKTAFAAVEEVFQLASDLETRDEAIKYWKCTLPDGATAVVPGFLTKNTLPIELEGSPVVEAEIQCTGPMVFTPGS